MIGFASASWSTPGQEAAGVAAINTLFRRCLRGLQMIEFQCSCGEPLRAQEKHAGRAFKCPKCGATLRVPQIDPKPAVVGSETLTPPTFDFEPVPTVQKPTQEKPSPKGSSSLFTRDLSGEFTSWAMKILRPPNGRWHKRQKERQKQQEERENRILSEERARGIVFSMIGVQDRLEVFDDKLTITPQATLMAFLNKGLKGTKTIPFTSIRATQFRAAGAVFSGFLQFSILGGIESTGGLLKAAGDENTFMFANVMNNELAKRIMEFIESKTHELQSPKTAPQSDSLADQLQSLSKLRDQGILSEDEFSKAKAKLIG